LVVISLFAKEIVSILFDPTWEYAVIALKFLPLAIAANIVNNPLTSFALIKERPEITLVYSISLFIGRMAGILFGFIIADFIGAVIGYVLLDSSVRYTRLIIDLRLYEIRISKFIINVLPNILTVVIIFVSYYLLSLTANHNKIVITLISLLFAMCINLIVTKGKIICYVKLFRKSMVS
jgi:O-antigen/teichoic acid export membrane protein